MEATGAQRPEAAGHTGRERVDDGRRTPAQWYSLIVGASLVLAGIAGFFVNSVFDTSKTDPQGRLDGDALLGAFEVNGWHNVVHLASGLFLLLMSSKRATARLAAISFGVVYGLVAIIGLIDGQDLLGLFPINPGDNILHIGISALGLLSGLISSGDDRELPATVAGREASAGTA